MEADFNITRAPGVGLEDFTYPGQILDETGCETLDDFRVRIRGKYKAEKVLVEKPRAKIAIYGDSFAAIGENTLSNRMPCIVGGSWIYFLANILDVECHSYAISCSGEGDISHYVHSTLPGSTYDYVIIFHTDPTRPASHSDDEHTFNHCQRMKDDLENYNTLHMYWDERHQFFNYSGDGKEIFISNYHKTNPNDPPDFVNPKDPYADTKPNPLDNPYKFRCNGFNHLSERGNLRLAVEISKIIDKYL